MDRYEYNLRLEQMKSLAAEGRYQEAAELADTINWRKIKNVTALARAGEIYEQVRRYEESREVLLMARSRSPMGRTILYRLVCVAVKLEKYDEAWGYYKEFIEAAPRDNLKYVLKYEISKAEGADYQTLILCLEDLKEQEPTEEWGYELAYLYHQAGMSAKCVEVCDEVYLYFGYGTYVEKALELKKQYQPLTPQQEESYKKFKLEKEGMQEEVLETIEAVEETAEFPKEELLEKPPVQNLQTTFQKGIQKFMSEAKKEDAAESRINAIKRLVKDIPYIRQQEEVQKTETVTDTLEQEETDKPELKAKPFEQAEADKPELKAKPFEQAEANKPELKAKPLKQEEVDKKELEPELLKQKELKMVKWEKQKLEETNKRAEEQEKQIRIVLPNGKVFEVQITGQMSFEEILGEWERTVQTATSVLKEEQTKQKAIKEKASQEAGDILERLMDVIPGANTGQRPKPAVVKEKKPLVLEPQKDKEEKAAQMVADMNQILQKEIDRISTENAQIEERIVAAQENTSNQELAAEIHAVMERQSRIVEENYSAEEDKLDSEAIQEPNFVNEWDIQVEESKTEQINAEDIVIEEIDIEEIDIREMEAETQSFEASKLAENPLDEILEESKSKETQKIERPFREEPDEEFLLELSQELIGRLEETTEELIPEIELPEDLNLEIELTELSQEQRETFSYITHIKGMEEQICIALNGIASRLKQGRTSNIGNLIVMGGSGSGKTVFATNFIKVLQQMTGRPNGKVGKIGASVLNEKDIDGLFGKIAGGCLIIESAGDLTVESTRRLGFLLEQDTQGTLVILEGLKHEIEKVLMRDKEFASKFSERIKIPIFTNDELVIFARAYAAENGYVIDEMGILALYNSISNIQKLDRETTIAEVKEIVDAAIAHVESGALKKAFSILTSSRFDEEDYVILHEKDFN